MSTIEFILAAVIITIAVVGAYLHYKEDSTVLRFPSGGLVPPDETLLHLTHAELDYMQTRDIYWLLEYARQKILSVSDENERLSWESLYDRIEDVCYNQISN